MKLKPVWASLSAPEQKRGMWSVWIVFSHNAKPLCEVFGDTAEEACDRRDEIIVKWNDNPKTS